MGSPKKQNHPHWSKWPNHLCPIPWSCRCHANARATGTAEVQLIALWPMWDSEMCPALSCHFDWNSETTNGCTCWFESEFDSISCPSYWKNVVALARNTAAILIQRWIWSCWEQHLPDLPTLPPGFRIQNVAGPTSFRPKLLIALGPAEVDPSGSGMSSSWEDRQLYVIGGIGDHHPKL